MKITVQQNRRKKESFKSQLFIGFSVLGKEGERKIWYQEEETKNHKITPPSCFVYAMLGMLNHIKGSFMLPLSVKEPTNEVMKIVSERYNELLEMEREKRNENNDTEG